MHAGLRRRLPIDAIYVCPHDDADRCACRKPAPGLLLDAAKDMGLDPRRSFMVGDQWRDIEAGQRAGCLTVHVDGNYAAQVVTADATVTSLPEATSWILATTPKERIV